MPDIRIPDEILLSIFRLNLETVYDSTGQRHPTSVVPDHHHLVSASQVNHRWNRWANVALYETIFLSGGNPATISLISEASDYSLGYEDTSSALLERTLNARPNMGLLIKHLILYDDYKDSAVINRYLVILGTCQNLEVLEMTGFQLYSINRFRPVFFTLSQLRFLKVTEVETDAKSIFRINGGLLELLESWPWIIEVDLPVERDESTTDEDIARLETYINDRNIRFND